jgi:hypothetical protein
LTISASLNSGIPRILSDAVSEPSKLGILPLADLGNFETPFS